MIDLQPGRPPSPTRDAATVIVLRDTAEGPEIFLVRRHGASGFMAGAHVFPGGRLDPADQSVELAARCRGRTDDEAARALGEPADPVLARALFVAAARETFEESGVLVADLASSAALTAAQAQTDVPFASVLATLDAHLRLDLLAPWGRWITPVVEPKRFDTRFFLARIPDGQEAHHDARETTAGEWMRAPIALARAASGEIQLPPPTLRNLEILGAFADVDAAFAAAATRRIVPITPVFHDVAGTFTLALPGDPLHPEREIAIEGGTQIVLREGRWWSKSVDSV